MSIQCSGISNFYYWNFKCNNHCLKPTSMKKHTSFSITRHYIIVRIEVMARVEMDKKNTNQYKLSMAIKIYKYLSQFYLNRNNFALSKALAIPELSLPPAVAKNGCPPPPP